MVRLGAGGLVSAWRGRSYRNRITPELWSAGATFCTPQDTEWNLPGEVGSTEFPENLGPVHQGLAHDGPTPPS